MSPDSVPYTKQEFAKEVSKWMLNDLRGMLRKYKLPFDTTPPEYLAFLIDLKLRRVFTHAQVRNFWMPLWLIF